MNKNPSPLAEQCEDAVNHAVAFLFDHLGPDGSYPTAAHDLVAHYKTPLVLKALGHPERASRALEFILETFLDEHGDLKRPGRKTDNAIYATHLSHYMNSWVVRGACALDRRDVAARLLEYLKTRQDPDTGGVCTKEGEMETDIGTAAAFGHAAGYGAGYALGAKHPWLASR